MLETLGRLNEPRSRLGSVSVTAQGDRVEDIQGLTGNYVQLNIFAMSMTPKALQDLLDELEASRASRKRAWAILQEIRWVLKDVAGIEIPPPARKTIDLEDD